MGSKLLIGFFAFLCSGAVGLGAEKSPFESYSKDKVHLFLLVGQSNMSGRGTVTEEDKKVHPRVFVLTKEGIWVPAAAPIHYDKKAAGTGPGKSFADTLAGRHEDIIIGLVPAACGGSPISTWEPGRFHKQTKSHPYDDAIERMRLALNYGELKGILWHQGEADSKPELADRYEAQLRGLICRFRKELDAPNVPFIVGQMGQFPVSPWNDSKKRVNAAQISVAREMDRVGWVSSEGLTCKKDGIHFNAESARELGRRYAEIYIGEYGE